MHSSCRGRAETSFGKSKPLDSFIARFLGRHGRKCMRFTKLAGLHRRVPAQSAGSHPTRISASMCPVARRRTCVANCRAKQRSGPVGSRRDRPDTAGLSSLPHRQIESGTPSAFAAVSTQRVGSTIFNPRPPDQLTPFVKSAPRVSLESGIPILRLIPGSACSRRRKLPNRSSSRMMPAASSVCAMRRTIIRMCP